MKATHQRGEDLCKQRYVVAGAGSAGAGALNFVRDTLVEKYGLSQAEANACFYVLDKDGLISTERNNIPELEANFDNIRDYAKDPELEGLGLEEIVAKVKPTILIGLSAVGGLFTEKVIKNMHEHCERPIVFALSNPTSRSEARAEGNFAILILSILLKMYNSKTCRNGRMGKPFLLLEARSKMWNSMAKPLSLRNATIVTFSRAWRWAPLSARLPPSRIACSERLQRRWLKKLRSMTC